jgi:hypothetical protein
MRMYVSYLRVHCWLRWAFGPFSGTSHRLTSPKVRTFHVCSTVRTKRKSAPFRVGYLRKGGPIRPITGRRSLFPSSPTLCSIPLPYGRDTTYVGSVATVLIVKGALYIFLVLDLLWLPGRPRLQHGIENGQ